jgi:arylsulfatase
VIRQKQPNILLILTDQQRADSVAALGNPLMRTPAFDRLCREGTAFTSAYTPCAVCVPARASLHYGRYPHRNNLFDNGPMPAHDGTSYADRLVARGYVAHAIGKRHFTPDRHALRGLTSVESAEEMVPDPQTDDYLRFLHAAGFDHITDPHGVRGEMYYIPQPAQMPARLHPTQWVGDRAIDFITRSSGDDKPWYLTASFFHPHPPFSPPAPWHKLYRISDVTMPYLPPDYETHWTYVNRLQNRYKYRDRGLDLNLIRMMRAYYAACVSFVDYQVGRIIAALEQAGVLEETLIVVTSDHGEYLGDFGCFGKRGMHDASARVPLIARWPAVFRQDERVDRPVSLVDIAPTFCAAGGASADGFDGLPLQDLAADATDRQTVFAQHGTGNKACYMAIDRNYKLFYSAADDEEFIYDRRVGPGDTLRHPGGPFEHPALKSLRGRLFEFLKQSHQTDAFIEASDGKMAWRKHSPPPAHSHPDEGLIIQDHRWANQRIEGYSPA